MPEEQKKKSLWSRTWFQNTIVILLTAALAYGMAAYEIVRRARVAYREGESFYSQGEYRKALWSYQEVLDFYTRPHSRWVDRAQEKVALCEDRLRDEDPVEALDRLFGLSVPKKTSPESASGSEAPGLRPELPHEGRLREP